MHPNLNLNPKHLLASIFNRSLDMVVNLTDVIRAMCL